MVNNCSIIKENTCKNARLNNFKFTALKRPCMKNKKIRQEVKLPGENHRPSTG